MGHRNLLKLLLPPKLNLFLAALIAMVMLTACTKASEPISDTEKSFPSTNSNKQNQNVEIVVFAAASLNKAYSEIAANVLSKTNPEIKVNFSFEGSSTLVEQIRHGAPADLIACADMKNMQKAVDAKLVLKPHPFASNVLTIIVPAGNPAKVSGFNESLNHANLVVCAPGVPCGNATAQIAKISNLRLKPVSEEQKVTDVRAKVETGEAQAGIVYVTDAKAAKNVEIIAIDGAEKVVNAYPLAIVANSKQKKAAQAFINAVLSKEGQAVLEKYGFSKPLTDDKG